MSSEKRNSSKKKQKNNSKIQRLLPAQERFHLHFSAVIFLAVFIYILVCLFNYAKKDTTGVYEVVAGTSGQISTYQAFIIRSEDVYYAPYSGFVNYYVSQGDRVRVNSTICTLDENGNFLSSLVSSASSLSDESLKKLKSALRTVSISYDANNYSQLYTEKNTLNTTLLSLLTDDSIAQYTDASDEYTFDIITTSESGTFASLVDGYEDFDTSNFDKSQINSKEYSAAAIVSGQLVEEGAPLYKIISSESFSILVELSEDDQVDLWFESDVEIYFPDIDKTVTGTYEKITDNSGNRYAKISFTDYGYMFANTRFTTVEIRANVEEGLKIPSSSLVSKDYTLVPKSFMTKGTKQSENDSAADEEADGFLKQVYVDGVIEPSFVAVDIVDSYDDDYYLIDSSVFEDGDILMMPSDTTQVYEVGAKKALTGVYSINKGYARFRRVYILSELEEGYVIVEEGRSDSISKYDRIALNGSLIKEGEIVY